MSGTKQKNVSRAALRGKKRQGVDQIEVEIAALDRRIREEAPLPGVRERAPSVCDRCATRLVI
jgi:hypothetical protein